MQIKNIDTVISDLGILGEKVQTSLDNTIRKVANLGLQTAKTTLRNTNHTQKFGDDLVNEIGVSHQNRLSRIFTPITQNQEMIAHMAYAEFGAGLTTEPTNQYFEAPPQRDKKGKTWTYYTTPLDKNPDKHRSRKGGEFARTNKSEPARFMYNARVTMGNTVGLIFKEEMVK